MDNKHPLLVGITGGIGSGKSTITKVFSTLGIPVYDADSRGKWLMNHSPELKAAIAKQFGEESYKQGILDNVYLASKVFNNPDKLNVLNSLVHPAVGRDFAAWVNEHKTFPYLVKESALLIESGSYKELDKLLVVYSPEDLRVRRIKQRDSHRSAEQIRDIIARQLSDAEKIKLADVVLTNDENHMLIPQIIKLHQQISNSQNLVS